MDTTIVFHCELCDHPARVDLNLSARGKREVACEIRVEALGLSISAGYTLLGYDLDRFINDLCKLHKTLAGTARLTTFDELLDLRLTVVDAGRGSVRLDVRLCLPIDGGSQAIPPLRPAPFGSEIQLVIPGLRMDQSYLPGGIQDLVGFMRESGVSIESPWA